MFGKKRKAFFLLHLTLLYEQKIYLEHWSPCLTGDFQAGLFHLDNVAAVNLTLIHARNL